MRSSRAQLVCLTAVALAVLHVHAGAARAEDPAAPNGGAAPAAPGTYSQTEIEGATRTRKPPAKGAPIAARLAPGRPDAERRGPAAGRPRVPSASSGRLRSQRADVSAAAGPSAGADARAGAVELGHDDRRRARGSRAAAGAAQARVAEPGGRADPALQRQHRLLRAGRRHHRRDRAPARAARIPICCHRWRSAWCALSANLRPEFARTLEARLIARLLNAHRGQDQRSAPSATALRSRVEDGSWVMTLGAVKQDDLRRVGREHRRQDLHGRRLHLQPRPERHLDGGDACSAPPTATWSGATPTARTGR